MKKIELIVCEDLNLSPELLHTRCRKKQYVEAKHIIIYLADLFSESSLSRYALGRYFQINHASAIHAIHKIDNYVRLYPFFRERIENHKKRISEMLENEIPEGMETEIELISAKQKIREFLLMNKTLEDCDVRKYNNLVSLNVQKSNKNYEIVEEKL
ncbi:MAG: hypothetical protein GX459_11275 [Bacteroidales bacterium]|nr:hypothetical protein [Bacteroidales bacterium]